MIPGPNAGFEILVPGRQDLFARRMLIPRAGAPISFGTSTRAFLFGQDAGIRTRTVSFTGRNAANYTTILANPKAEGNPKSKNRMTRPGDASDFGLRISDFHIGALTWICTTNLRLRRAACRTNYTLRAWEKAPSINIQAPEKLQAPSSRETPIPKLQDTKDLVGTFAFWNLELLWSLGFEAWSFPTGPRGWYRANVSSSSARR